MIKAVQNVEVGFPKLVNYKSEDDVHKILMKYHGEIYLKSLTGGLIFRRTHLEHILRATELIEQLHNLGFVHGDLHPQNMVIQPDKSLCIIDFNCSRRVGES